MPIIPAQGGGSSGGTGDVVGPASATDTAIAVYDGATGELLKDSLVTIDANGTVEIPAAQVLRFGDTNYLSYVDTVGPRWSDGTAGFRVTHNLQSLGAHRTVAWPDSAGTVVVGSAVASTVGAAGVATALPAAPLGYLTVTLPDGSSVKIPYYNT